MSSACFSASRLRVRIRIIDSCSMSLRSLRRGFDVLDQLGQALGVEAVRRIEEFEVGLVEIGDRHRLRARGRSAPGLPGADSLTRVTYSPRRSCISSIVISEATERSAETNLPESSASSVGDVHGAPAERGGGDGHRLRRRRHPHIELRLDVDAHAVLGDERVVAIAHHLHAQHVHVDRRDLVNEREHEGAAVDHHFFAEQAGAHEGELLRGTAVEPVHEIDDDRDDDDRDDQPDDQATKDGDGHLTPSRPPTVWSAAGLFFTLICSFPD